MVSKIYKSPDSDDELFQNFSEVMSILKINKAKEICEKFRSIVYGDKKIYECFTFLASGAFKEVYELDSNHVIKFVSLENDTEKEAETLRKAEEVGVSEIFLPTFFIPLGPNCPIFLYDLYKENNFDDSYYDTVFSSEEECAYVLIQPRIFAIQNDKSYINVPASKEEYSKTPLDTDISYSTIHRCNISSYSWISETYTYFGKDFFMKLSDFIYNNKISDLHPANIGYRKEGDKIIPCILDWLS